MKTFSEKLAEEKTIFDDDSLPYEKRGYKKPTMAEVYKDYLEYRQYKGLKAEETAYNSQIEEWIAKKEGIESADLDYLGTEVYLAQQQYHEEQRQKQINSLKAMGFERIESKEEYNGKKVEFIVDNSDSIFGGWNRLKGKLFWSSTDKALMAMKPRCSRRGYWISDKVYVKFI